MLGLTLTLLGYVCRNLNMMAFVKILKKFEKITGKQALAVYLKVVESSYFNSSDEARARFALFHHPLSPCYLAYSDRELL